MTLLSGTELRLEGFGGASKRSVFDTTSVRGIVKVKRMGSLNMLAVCCASLLRAAHRVG